MSLGSIEEQERKRLIYGEGEMPTAEQDLETYLAGEFQAGEPLRLVGSRCDAVGRRITDRVVSRLEVLSAMTALPLRQRRGLELRYVEGLGTGEAARRLGISTSTLYADRREALRAMAARIYEWEGNGGRVAP